MKKISSVVIAAIMLSTFSLTAYAVGNEACSHNYSTTVLCGEYKGTTSKTHVYVVNEYGYDVKKDCQLTIMLKRHAARCSNCGGTPNGFDSGSPCTETHSNCGEGTKSCH